MTKHLKLSHFSAIAASTAALGAGAAHAADLAVVADKEWKVSVEGGFLWAEPGSSYTGDKIGFTGVDDAEGGYGAFSVGRDINDTLDWRLSAAFTAFEEAVNDFVFEFGDEGFSIDDFDHQTVDFDLGWNTSTNNVTWRLFGGVSFAHIETSSFTSVEEFPLIESDQDEEFYGAGPRIGAEFSYGQTYGVAGLFSAAVFGGSRDTTGSLFIDGDLEESVDDEETVWVGNLRASLGVFAKPSESTTFTVGYRVDAWFNVRGESLSSEFTQDEDTVSHGPFVKVATEF
jgi:hypothetical protein